MTVFKNFSLRHFLESVYIHDNSVLASYICSKTVYTGTLITIMMKIIILSKSSNKILMFVRSVARTALDDR